MLCSLDAYCSYIDNLPSHFLLTLNSQNPLLYISLYKTPSKKHNTNKNIMAKVGKLRTKLKSAIKRWPSLTKLTRTTSSTIAATDSDDKISEELHAVYVGKSRRRYFVTSDIVYHPLFQELIDRSSGFDDGEVVVACEVVLFEHLLWMLESGGSQLGSMEELVEFYTTC